VLNSAGRPSHRSSASEPRRPWWRSLLRGLFLLTFVLGCMGVGVAFYYAHRLSGRSRFDLFQTGRDLSSYVNAVFRPEEVFPGRRRLTILCMGLDRNWTRDNLPYTKNARTDTMMVASLDLKERTVSVISIPRDTRIRMPGTATYAKINEAHSRGGPQYSVRAVESILGVPIDYYLLIKQEAVEKGVNAIGGLVIDVEKRMEYHDRWGHLHIDLEPGEQLLDGEQVVGYMRFRHDAEGDFGRIRRQQQVIHTVAQRFKDPRIVAQLPQLFDVLNEYVKTNLTKEQLLALGRMFHHIDTKNLQTASLPGRPVTIAGGSYVEPDWERTRLLVDWLVRGNEEAGNRLITVEVVDGVGAPEVAREVVDLLEAQGFDAVYVGRAPRGKTYQITVVVERGSVPRAGRRVLSALGVGGQVRKEGGAATARCTLYIGQDVRNARRQATAVGRLSLAAQRES